MKQPIIHAKHPCAKVKNWGAKALLAPGSAALVHIYACFACVACVNMC